MSEPPAPDPARQRRNVALGLLLLAFVALIFLVTIVRLQSGVLERPI